MQVKKIKSIGVGLMILLMAACTQPSGRGEDPKSRLKSYISKSFEINDVAGRKDLESFLVGDSRVRLEAWSNEQFKKAFIDSKRHFLKLAFKDTHDVSVDEVQLTYELTYLDRLTENETKVTHKKLAHLVRLEGIWMIKEVKNIKELVEYQNELSLP